MSFTKFGKFSTVISLNTFSSALSSPVGTFNMDGSPFVIVPQAPETVHFFQSFSLLFRWVNLINLCPCHWFCPLISTVLLSPANELFLLVIFSSSKNFHFLITSISLLRYPVASFISGEFIIAC